MALPYGLESTIRVHDEAFYNWLGDLTVDYGDANGLLTEERNNFPILRTFAGPQRAYASVTDLLVRQGFVSGGTAQKMRDEAGNFAVLPLPIATIERGQATIDTERATPPRSIVNAHFDVSTEKWERHENPTVYTLPYTVTFWCIKQYTMNYILEFLYSQFGKLGSAQNEKFLTVRHAEPWQSYEQSLKFDGTSDLTEVEGENPAYKRVEATFNLRMLHFRPKEESDYGSQTIYPSQDFFSGEASDGVDTQTPTDPSDAELSTSSGMSGNLFTFYVRRMSEWNKEGNATAVRGDIGARNAQGRYESLRIGVTDSTDVADVVTRVVGLDSDNQALLSISFCYQSVGATRLNLSEKAGIDGAFSKVYELDLPEATSWTQVHFFAALSQKLFSLSIEGTGMTASITLDKVGVKHICSNNKTTAIANVNGNYIDYSWSGLDDSQAYLVVAPITQDTQSSVSGDFLFRDATVGPQFTRSVPARQEFSGVVGLIQPKPESDTVSLSIPDTFVVGTPYLQIYDGFFDGHVL
jgi:hypothetical protein